MPRRYRRPYRSKKYKWSLEFTSSRVLVGPVGVDVNVPIVSPVYDEGTRCVKNFDIQLTTQASGTIVSENTSQHGYHSELSNIVFYWALVYVPHGYEPRNLNLPDTDQEYPTGRSTDLYLANQFVIAAGVQSMLNPTFRIRSRLARNLNSGDRIFLVVQQISNIESQLSSEQVPVNVLAKYAVCYK